MTSGQLAPKVEDEQMIFARLDGAEENEIIVPQSGWQVRGVGLRQIVSQGIDQHRWDCESVCGGELAQGAFGALRVDHDAFGLAQGVAHPQRVQTFLPWVRIFRELDRDEDVDENNGTATPALDPLPGCPVAQPGVGGDQHCCPVWHRFAKKHGPQEKKTAVATRSGSIARLQVAEQQPAPSPPRQLTQALDPLGTQPAALLMHPAAVFQAHAIDARVPQGADVTAQQAGDVGVKGRGWMFSFQTAAFSWGATGADSLEHRPGRPDHPAAIISHGVKKEAGGAAVAVSNVNGGRLNLENALRVGVRRGGRRRPEANRSEMRGLKRET